MARSKLKGCGCVIAVLVVVLAAAAFVGVKYVRPWLKLQPPPASGGELQVHVLDVGPGEGDSILIIAPGGKSVLIDAGDTGKGKAVLDALKRYNVQQLDYFIATHPHPDHIGGADEVIKSTKVLNVIDNGLGPDVPESLAGRASPPRRLTKNRQRRSRISLQPLRSFTMSIKKPLRKAAHIMRRLRRARNMISEAALV